MLRKGHKYQFKCGALELHFKLFNLFNAANIRQDWKILNWLTGIRLIQEMPHGCLYLVFKHLHVSVRSLQFFEEKRQPNTVSDVFLKASLTGRKNVRKSWACSITIVI